MASGSKKVIYAAFAANIIIATVKFIAAALTGSSAMFSEGIHTTVDTGNQILLLLGMKRAKKPADKRYPFGYGNEIYFWSFIVAVMIFAVGAGISIYEGVHSVMHPHPIEDPLISYIVLGAAIIATGSALYFAIKEFKQAKGQQGYFEAVHKAKNPVTFVVLFEDSAALLGLFIALAGIALSQWTGRPVFDGIASICIGVILGSTATWLAFESKGLLIGERANPDIVEGITVMAKKYHEIAAVNETVTLHMGPHYILVNLSVDFDNSIDAVRIETAVTRLNNEIKNRYPQVKRVFIEAEQQAP